MINNITTKDLHQEEEWDKIIRPKRHLLDINLKELWDYKFLIYLFVRRDLVARYKQTILGPFWFIINPLISTIIYSIVFGQIAGISTDGLPHYLFYMSGIVAWNYFAGALNGTATTFISNANIFGKVYFPRLVSPISVVISNLLQFVIQFGLLLVFMMIFYFKGANFSPNVHALFIPVLIFLMALMGLGFGIIISSLTTKYRDLSNLVGFGVQLWMYATPVIYPSSTVPEKFRGFVALNPVSPIIEIFRYGMLGGTFPGYNGILYSTLFAFGVLSIGVVLFNRVEQTFMDTV